MLHPFGEERCVPVQTVHGEPHGRDAIWLSGVEFDAQRRRLTLRGAVSAERLTRPPPGRDAIPYRAEFTDVLGFRFTDLDCAVVGESAFDEVMSSRWVREMRDQDHSSKVGRHRHFIVAAYDEAFEIVVEGHWLEFDPAQGMDSTD